MGFVDFGTMYIILLFAVLLHLKNYVKHVVITIDRETGVTHSGMTRLVVRSTTHHTTCAQAVIRNYIHYYNSYIKTSLKLKWLIYFLEMLSFCFNLTSYKNADPSGQMKVTTCNIYNIFNYLHIYIVSNVSNLSE